MKQLLHHLTLTAIVPATLAASAVHAAPGLSFNVSAHVASANRSSIPGQTVQAHVLLSGQRARIDTTSGGTRAIVLYSPPYIYRLLPGQRAGVKWKLSQVQSGGFAGFDPQQLLRHPAQIRTALLQNGAKFSGRSQIGGVPVDVYEMTRATQRFSHVKAWLRHSDALPLRLEAQNGGLKVVALWSHYARIGNVSSAQFAPPGGYSIRQSQNPPILPLL